MHPDKILLRIDIGKYVRNSYTQCPAIHCCTVVLMSECINECIVSLQFDKNVSQESISDNLPVAQNL